MKVLSKDDCDTLLVRRYWRRLLLQGPFNKSVCSMKNVENVKFQSKQLLILQKM